MRRVVKLSESQLRMMVKKQLLREMVEDPPGPTKQVSVYDAEAVLLNFASCLSRAGEGLSEIHQLFKTITANNVNCLVPADQTLEKILYPLKLKDEVLLGYAKRFGRQLGLNVTELQKEMMSGDYEHLLEVFDKNFGEFVTLYK